MPALPSLQLVPSVTWFAWQLPLPSQLSAASHSPVLLDPHAVPATVFGCVHTPAPHTSAVHSLLSAVHAVPSAAAGFEHCPVDGSHVPGS